MLGDEHGIVIGTIVCKLGDGKKPFRDRSVTKNLHTQIITKTTHPTYYKVGPYQL